MQLLHVPISRQFPSVPARTPTALARTYLSFAVEKRESCLKPTSRCYSEDTENENENKIWYYSTKVQLAELIDCLDKDYWEAELCKILEEMREEIHRHMDITEDLTDKARGSNKSFLATANGLKNIYTLKV
ncbi:nucleosome-remodeling factor subunit BPTF [Pongo pygmaeus]|uniref:nucleosome-remodeling factor subunit BPTF n=1 Tax=Pongo pygmaeus TaxID=9600 RepID=UPI0023E3116E|nr:nucleosome-remodeling factor subunit BPTF [Pongo pygmaeus]